jgi:hypothetical protein
MTHLLAQRAVVRMLFDPEFAAAARRDPDGVLAALDPPLRRQLCAVDDRAFRQDRLRRRRALHTLAEELKASTTLVLAETRSLAFLESFFCSAAFHQAVEERGSMPLAFAAFLGEAVVDGRLLTPLLGDVVAIESALAHARRTKASENANAKANANAEANANERIEVAPGVIALEVAAGALAALQAAERYLFEVSLMPAVALCDDAPRLVLDAAAADRTRLCLVTVPTADGVSLVTVDAELHLVLRCLPGVRPRAAVLAEAAARGLDPTRAAALLAQLIEDELVERRHGR